MAYDQFNVIINNNTLAKILDNTVVDNLPDKKLMVDFLVRIIMKSNNGNDFFMALTNTFPKVLFQPGDKVRIKRSTLWYSINNEASVEAGYIEGDGVYAYIKEVNHASSQPYTACVTFIDHIGHIETRETDISNDAILMDNTILVSKPSTLPGDII
jgi:hypothetical protein